MRGSRASFSGTRTVSFCGSRDYQMYRGLCVDSSACFPAARHSARLCVEVLFSRQASRLFPLWKSGGVVLARPCVEDPVAPKASRRSASVCGDFLATEQAVRKNIQRTKSPNEK
ncbi:hypothetical protein NDU88_004964 [Pleurodeles waltl]|uniref:Uncharacterized protein n=1 Tax=Pleurodeles waltl TaxID=8319 RepID=A0AAV7V4H2_PLEWA|nr:hypothetical protein NDU88_004964 [Pleurodeles waltl]